MRSRTVMPRATTLAPGYKYKPLPRSFGPAFLMEATSNVAFGVAAKGAYASFWPDCAAARIAGSPITMSGAINRIIEVDHRLFSTVLLLAAAHMGTAARN